MITVSINKLIFQHISLPIQLLCLLIYPTNDQLPCQGIFLLIFLSNSVVSSLLAQLIYPLFLHAILLLIYQAIPLPIQLSHYPLTLSDPHGLSSLHTDLAMLHAPLAHATKQLDRLAHSTNLALFLAISIHLSRATTKSSIVLFIFLRLSFYFLFYFVFFFFVIFWHFVKGCEREGPPASPARQQKQPKQRQHSDLWAKCVNCLHSGPTHRIVICESESDFWARRDKA